MTTSAATLLLAHLLATAGMMGLIWFVQVVHYPLFAAVGAERFTAYELEHQRRTSFVVGPLMGVEGVTALWLAIAPPDGIGRLLPIIGLGVLGAVHASTVFLQVPAHGALGGGFDPAIARRLVRTNWIRTIGWSARAIIAGVLVGQVL